MEIHQLRYAVAVADLGTFTAAARACFVAQPSLSQAVRALETELGSPLFHRLARGVTLTAAGDAFVPAARATLRALDTARAAVDAVTGLRSGHLDLVALPTLAVDPVTPLIGRFRLAYPGVVVRLAQPEDTAAVMAMVSGGRAELGLTEAPVSDDGLVVHPLGQQDVVAVLPPGSPPRRRLRGSELAALPLVSLPVGTSSRRLLDEALASSPQPLQFAVETEQREALVPLVLAGAGACVLPRPMATEAARRGAVVAPLDPPLRRTLALLHRDAPLSPAASAFVTLATADAGGITATSSPTPRRGRGRSRGADPG
jgi:DNA-binding transcriptional LysR family regulator